MGRFDNAEKSIRCYLYQYRNDSIALYYACLYKKEKVVIPTTHNLNL